jgi:nitroreductase
MMDLELYDMISKRKSVRKYEGAPLSIGDISEILEFAGNAEPLHKEIKTKIVVVSRDDVNVFLPVISPHYLMMTSEESEGYLENAGFLLQQVDLFLSSKGFGSCYVGMALPSKEARKMSELKFVIFLAFGKPEEPLQRTDPSQFRRKDMEEITDISKFLKDIDSFDAVTDLLESVRLAPSATNSQPWFLVSGKDKLDFYCVKQGLLKSIGYRKMNKIDMGIALCHYALAAAHSGKTYEFICDREAQKRRPKDYYYTGTILLK